MLALRTMGATPESLEKPSEELAGEELLLVTSAIRTLERIDLKWRGKQSMFGENGISTAGV